MAEISSLLGFPPPVPNRSLLLQLLILGLKGQQAHPWDFRSPFVLTDCSVTSTQPRKGSEDNKPPTLLLAFLLSTSTTEDGLAKGGRHAEDPLLVKQRDFMEGGPSRLIPSEEGLTCSSSSGNTDHPVLKQPQLGLATWVLNEAVTK